MLLCMDFDGVVVDGSNECLIVSWLAFHNKGVPKDPTMVLDGIPSTLSMKFNNLRNYVRHDGHFIVPYLFNGDLKIGNQEDFDQVFSSIKPSIIQEFSRVFQSIRRKIRQDHAGAWFSYHNFYPNIRTVFNQGHDIHIVSGKDTPSIQAILEKNNIFLGRDKIHGGLRTKISVLKSLYQDSLSQHGDMIFIDDNLPNVLESSALGIRTLWADWGFNTVEHLRTAKMHAIKATTLSEFINLTQTKKNSVETAV